MWAITSEERTKHDKQFDNLKPSGGYITGLYLIFVILFIINVFLFIYIIVNFNNCYQNCIK